MNYADEVREDARRRERIMMRALYLSAAIQGGCTLLAVLFGYLLVVPR